jgi:2-amino-4-hydroxy-6-hydroxymethyldihydropteridine diphosphokinase
MSRVFIGIGSNEGDRLANISQAVRWLGSTSGIRLVQMATILETEPVGGPPQGPYLNTVVEVEAGHEPQALLAMLQAIERRVGRLPTTQRWGPRPIDLDLLLYDDRLIQESNLIVPHPRMHERAFVLEPLAQLAPELRHPIFHETITSLRERCRTANSCSVSRAAS